MIDENIKVVLFTKTRVKAYRTSEIDYLLET